MKLYKKILITVCFYIFWTSFALSRDIAYPIQEMSKVECRFQNFDALWSNCKMTLPILKTTDYKKYKNDYSLYRRVYTMLWWTTYTYWWDVWNWWHSWVDIASAKWTPVYSIADWKVVWSWFLPGRWNTVKISHYINWKTIYSIYSHLSKIDVKYLDNTKTLTKIWEVWSTWNSTWNHLHFQIDLSVSWHGPRYRWNCPIKNYNSIVNSNTCFPQLNNNTVDPLLFLETNWAIIKQTSKPKIEKISQNWLLSREEILKREIREFLKKYDVSVKITNIWWNIELWKTWTFRITVIDKRTKKPFNWSFPWDMNFKYNSKDFDIFPSWILQIDNWRRDFTITPKKDWKLTLNIYIGETYFKRVDFWVIDTKQTILPYKTSFLIWNSSVISDSKKWALYFKNKYWLNILWLEFKWKYILKSENNNIKFCIKRVTDLKKIRQTFNTPCLEENFEDEISFSYSDTVLWILLFDYKVKNIWNNKLIISSSSNNEISSKNIVWKYPIWLSKNHTYYNEIINTLKKAIATWLNKWYFLEDRDLSKMDWINFIKNAIKYNLKKCDNSECRVKYNKNLILIRKENNSKFSYFTRWEFLEKIWEYIILDRYDKKDFIAFRDINIEQLAITKNLLKNNTFKDSFWQTRYFQPNKNITRAEASFLINFAFK